MDAVTAFAVALRERGIDLYVRNNRLRVWPPKAYGYLTDAEREFMRAHRDELKALAASKVLPDATVVWQPPSDTPAAAAPTSYRIRETEWG